MSAVFEVWEPEIPSSIELAVSRTCRRKYVGQKLRYDFRSSGFVRDDSCANGYARKVDKPAINADEFIEKTGKHGLRPVAEVMNEK